MALVSASVLVVEQSPSDGCLQCLCPQGEPQFFLTYPEESPRSADGFDPGSFQITASALDPKACEIFVCTF